MNSWAHTISGLLLSVVGAACVASVPADSAISGAYFEAARKLHVYEQTLGKEVRAIASSACKDCEFEEEIDVMTYDDVLRLLQYALENDQANHKARLLIARIRLARSILGFGDYDRDELRLAKEAIDHVPVLKGGGEFEKERMVLSASIAEALHKGN